MKGKVRLMETQFMTAVKIGSLGDEETIYYSQKAIREIDETLKEKKMSRRELARRIGMPPSTLQSIMEQGRDLPVTVYLRIKEALEVRNEEEKAIGVLSKEQKETLTKACYDFALRVLEGKRMTPQETATLPGVLDFLRASNAGPYSNFGSSAGSE